MDRNEAIAAMRAALKTRSGKAWSVTGGTGTAWGWISISAPPARRDQFGSMTTEDATELAELLGIPFHQTSGGVQIPASDDYRIEYVARAQGVTPIKCGTPYWD